jgi:hypothetical protein
MLEYERIYQLVKEAGENNGWIMLGLFYGGFFFLGAVGAKVALYFADYIGAVLAVLAIASLYGWYDKGAGAFFLFAYPPAWTSWGVLVVCGRRFYLALHAKSG